MFKCSKCGERKSEQEFYVRSNGIIRRDCKVCFREKVRCRYFKAHEDRLARRKIRRNANRDVIKARNRRYYLANKDKVYAGVKKYRAAHPHHWIGYVATRRARKRGGTGRITLRDLRAIRANQNDMCAYCSAHLNGRGHLDHKKPLSRGGTHTVKNVHYTCQSCNDSKGTMTHVEFIKKMGATY